MRKGVLHDESTRGIGGRRGGTGRKGRPRELRYRARKKRKANVESRGIGHCSFAGSKFLRPVTLSTTYRRKRRGERYAHVLSRNKAGNRFIHGEAYSRYAFPSLLPPIPPLSPFTTSDRTRIKYRHRCYTGGFVFFFFISPLSPPSLSITSLLSRPFNQLLRNVPLETASTFVERGSNAHAPKVAWTPVRHVN